MDGKLKERLIDFGAYLVLTLATIISVFPLLWMILSSFKGRGELSANPTRFIPQFFTWEYYEHVLFELNFLENIKNSLVISLSTTLIAIVISSMAAYGIVRFFP